MSAFASLSALIRAGFALWALLLCLMNIGAAVLAAVRKRGSYTVLAFALFVPVYFLWQVIFDLSLYGDTENAAKTALTLGALAWPVWLAALLLLTLGSALLLRYDLRYDKNFITRGTIKLYLDQVPCGVCCWKDSGRVLFSNVCMNRLCESLTGGPLLNGNAFRETVSGGILTAEDRVWRFSLRDFGLDGENLHEMTASDITAEYGKMQALEQDKAELSTLNKELREYYLSMDDVIRRQEILQARVHIHDEMNRLMLLTMAADGEDTEKLDTVFSLWEQNALLLGKEADKDRETAEMIERLASALGIRLVRKNALPDSLSDAQRGLYYAALQEAIVNAVKHAKAKTMTISFTETEDRILCGFANDGAVPEHEIKFSGGLANLSLLAGKQGASVSVSFDKAFTLSVCFPKDQPIG